MTARKATRARASAVEKKAVGTSRKAATKKKAAKNKTTAPKKKASARKARKKAAKRVASGRRTTASAGPYGRVRAMILALPETFEKISHGEPTFWGGKRTFVTFADNHHADGRMAIWLKLPPGEQEDLIEMNPEVFFLPPYVGPSGWVGIRLDLKVDWGLVEMLIEQGYRTVAPARAIAALEGALNGRSI
jgi:hypothetical protein